MLELKKATEPKKQDAHLVEITAYSHEQFDTLLALHMSQDYKALDTVLPETLPAIGFIAYDMATPIAAGFLRRVEGGYAQIDTLVSNGSLSSQMRHEGITAIVSALVSVAKSLELRGIVSFTEDKGTLMRAESIGFHARPHCVLVLPLEVD